MAALSFSFQEKHEAVAAMSEETQIETLEECTQEEKELLLPNTSIPVFVAVVGGLGRKDRNAILEAVEDPDKREVIQEHPLSIHSH